MSGRSPSGRATHEPGLASRPGHSVSVPNAAFRCVHCGHTECIPHIFTGHMRGVPMVDCAACGIMHSPPNTNSPRSLRQHIEKLTEELRTIAGFLAAIRRESPNGECVSVQYHPNGDWTVRSRTTAAQGIEAREGQDRETGLGRNDESPVAESDAPNPSNHRRSDEDQGQ